jgi:regulator of RNase E activity RraA
MTDHAAPPHAPQPFGETAETPSPATLADILGAGQVLDPRIRTLWSPVPRVAGPAFTVRCPPGDNLMLHAAIHRAPPGSVIVVGSGDLGRALAGGNVCAVARRRGIAAFVLDGLVRDLPEIRAAAFPVFARGVIPVAGAKERLAPLRSPVLCGGVRVADADHVVADEEGVVVIPAADRDAVLLSAARKEAADAAESLDAWEAAHRRRIDGLLRERGFTE